jgi:hypothetical protein
MGPLRRALRRAGRGRVTAEPASPPCKGDQSDAAGRSKARKERRLTAPRVFRDSVCKFEAMRWRRRDAGCLQTLRENETRPP